MLRYTSLALVALAISAPAVLAHNPLHKMASSSNHEDHKEPGSLCVDVAVNDEVSVHVHVAKSELEGLKHHQKQGYESDDDSGSDSDSESESGDESGSDNEHEVDFPSWKSGSSAPSYSTDSAAEGDAPASSNFFIWINIFFSKF